MENYSEGNYTNNQLDGKYHIYFEDGTTKSEYNYLNGNLHGEQIIYHENGQIAQKDFYDYGQTHGRDISYYDNGVMSHDRTLFMENYMVVMLSMTSLEHCNLSGITMTIS